MVSPASYDEVFAEVAGRSGSIDGLLQHFFGFLHRRTDFYVEYDAARIKAPSMGFPSGAQEQMVLRALRRHSFKPYDEGGNTSSGAQQSARRAAVPASAAPTKVGQTELFRLNSKGDKHVPVGNGGVGPGYYWTQSLTELTVFADVAAGSRGKDIQCEIRADGLRLACRGEVIMEGGFEAGERVRTGESVWTLSIATDRPPQVVITLDKARGSWWKHVLQGHPQIDTSLVDSSSKICDYDDATQAAIRKLMFDQQQRAQGLPPSAEIEKSSILEMAATLPGSPFL